MRRPVVLFLVLRVRRCSSVSDKGKICTNILDAEWSPTYTPHKLLSSLQTLLNNPNAASPLNFRAAGLCIEDSITANTVRAQARANRISAEASGVENKHAISAERHEIAAAPLTAYWKHVFKTHNENMAPGSRVTTIDAPELEGWKCLGETEEKKKAKQNKL